MSTNISKAKKLIHRVALPAMLAAPLLVSAGPQTPQNTASFDPGTLVTGTGVFESTSITGTIALVIRFALGFLGIVIFLIFLLAGFEYATSGGDEDKSKKATSRMVNAIIGLIIIFFAFVASNAILGFVFSQ